VAPRRRTSRDVQGRNGKLADALLLVDARSDALMPSEMLREK
jgi:hypothetical protein